MSDVAQNVRRVICGVVAEALRATGATAVTVLESETAAGGLLVGWLNDGLGGDRVRMAASVASNLHADAGTLLAHPASKTALLLGGAPPRVDLFPLGDLYASRIALLGAAAGLPHDVAALAAAAVLPHDVAALAEAAGGVGVLDAALERLIDGREPAAAALDGLADDVAGELLRLHARGRWFRRYAPAVPKLGSRTFGVDLFD